jgi:hypothetical protein
MPTMEQEASKGGSVDDRVRREDKVISRFDLNLMAAFGAGSSGHSAIRVTRGKEETGRGGRCARPQQRSQDCHRETESKKCKNYPSVHFFSVLSF